MAQPEDELEECLRQLPDFHILTDQDQKILFKLQAHFALKKGEELQAACKLSEAHCPSFRSKAAFQFNKILWKRDSLNLKRSRDIMALHCKKDESFEMLRQLEEMPKEWSLIQFTGKYNKTEDLNEDHGKYYTNGIYLSVLSCGKNGAKPFVVPVDAPKCSVSGAPVEIYDELMYLISKNRDILTGGGDYTNRVAFRNAAEKEKYMMERNSIEDRFKMVVRDMQNLWLKHWRCLLIGKYVEQDIEESIHSNLKSFLKTNFPDGISNKQYSMLYYILKGSCYMTAAERKAAIFECFPNIAVDLAKKIAKFLSQINNQLMLDVADRHPVILILEETLDVFPWEMIDVLLNKPVTRVPSLHFLYMLFKEHEADIVDGHKIVKNHEQGCYIVNPDENLPNMEIRIMNFFNYWTPNWTGVSGYKPTDDEFYEYLTSSEIFSYNGHGGGGHLLNLDSIQKTQVRAVVLLFGCGSTKIRRVGPQAETYGSYLMYLIARCPCLVGMLWEVTDLATDLLTTEFLSLWVPSNRKPHWKFVVKKSWEKANRELEFMPEDHRLEVEQEFVLSKALSLAKNVVPVYMTKSACVVRGLPVKMICTK